MLILLACIAFGWIAVKLRQARKEREAVEILEGLGASVHYPPGLPRDRARGEGWLGTLLGDDSLFAHPHFVKLGSLEGLEHLEGLTQLKILSLDGTQVTDAEMQRVERLTQLKHLSLESTRITDIGLEHFQRLTLLKSLSLKRTQITDAGLEHLEELKRLEALPLPGATAR